MLKATLRVPLLVTLQGDDVYLDQLPEPFLSSARKEIEKLTKCIDGFLVHSQQYADYMSGYLQISRERFHQVKLGIAAADFVGPPESAATGPRGPESLADREPTIGYLARLAPEKGLHLLCDAFMRIRQREKTANAQLRIAGWLGSEQRQYAETLFRQLESAGYGDAFRYEGEVTRAQKIAFLQAVDVLCVPATRFEPKGLYVLEALAAGVPVVLPRRGAFPELLEATGGGLLVEPDSAEHLADGLHELLTNLPLRRWLASQGQASVHKHFTTEAMAQSTWEVYRQFL